jgi:hypothetical protein
MVPSDRAADRVAPKLAAYTWNLRDETSIFSHCTYCDKLVATELAHLEVGYGREHRRRAAGAIEF